MRDVLWKEDATYSKNLNPNGYLAVLRRALIALETYRTNHLSWFTISDLSAMKRTIPFSLVCKKNRQMKKPCLKCACPEAGS